MGSILVGEPSAIAQASDLGLCSPEWTRTTNPASRCCDSSWSPFFVIAVLTWRFDGTGPAVPWRHWESPATVRHEFPVMNRPQRTALGSVGLRSDRCERVEGGPARWANTERALDPTLPRRARTQ